MMLRTANASAVVSCAAGLAAWLPQIELYVRIFGGLVAATAGALAIIVHVRTLRKKEKK